MRAQGFFYPTPFPFHKNKSIHRTEGKETFSFLFFFFTLCISISTLCIKVCRKEVVCVLGATFSFPPEGVVGHRRYIDTADLSHQAISAPRFQPH
jgi:hypothetical protein